MEGRANKTESASFQPLFAKATSKDLLYTNHPYVWKCQREINTTGAKHASNQGAEQSPWTIKA